MMLTNRKMFVAWLGLVVVILMVFTFGWTAKGHPLTGWHDGVKALARNVHYVLAPVAGDMPEQPSRTHNGMVALTVDVTPAHARVRVMNIGPAYQPGMELEPGSYDIEVSAPGYETQRRWVSISGRSAAPVFRLRN